MGTQEQYPPANRKLLRIERIVVGIAVLFRSQVDLHRLDILRRELLRQGDLRAERVVPQRVFWRIEGCVAVLCHIVEKQRRR